MAIDREGPQSIQDTYGPGAFEYNGKVYIASADPRTMPWNTGAYGNRSGYTNSLYNSLIPFDQLNAPQSAISATPGAIGAIPIDALNNAVTQYGVGISPPESFMDKLGLPIVGGIAGLGLADLFGGGWISNLFGGGGDALGGINPASWLEPTDTFAAGESGLGALGTDIGNVPVSMLGGPEGGLDVSGIGPYEGEAPFTYGDASSPQDFANSIYGDSSGGGMTLADLSNGGSGSIGGALASAGATGANGASGIWDWIQKNPGLVGAGANLLGGGLQALSANKAANTQANAAMQAIAAQQGIYNQQRADLMPFMQTGQQANTTLAGLTGLQPGGGFNQNAMLVKPFGMSDLQADPFFKPEFTQLSQDVLNRHSALGGVNSGATLKDLNDYALATGYQNAYNRYNNNLNNVWNRLYSLSGSGQNAAATTGGFAGQLGAGMAQNLTGAGNAQAAGQVGVGNALGGGLAGAYNAYLTNQILNNPGTTVQLKV